MPPVTMVSLARDPFAGARQSPAAAPSVIPGGTIGPSPHAFAVVAVATGVTAHALVTQDGTTRLVAAGDRLYGFRVVSVGPTGIRLDDGAFVGLSGRP